MSLPISPICCASHRLNLGLNFVYASFDEKIDAVQKLRVKLANLKNSALLRRKTKLRPILRNVSCWSSTFAMIQLVTST